MMGCPTCGNEGECIEIWENERGTFHTFYCETCSKCYTEKIDSSKQSTNGEKNGSNN